MRYNPYFENLIRGRQQEFLVYSEIYKVSEALFGKLRLNIYDQITDIDGIDFLIRAEKERKVIYIEGQVKKTYGSILYVTKGNSLQQLVRRANKRGSTLIIFAVDYDKKTKNSKGIYFYTGHELEEAHHEFGINSLNLNKLNAYIHRNTSIPKLGTFLVKMFK